MKKSPNFTALWSAAFSLFVLFALSAAPIPLFSLYQRQIGLATNELALTAVFYFAGTLTVLLLFSRLSDYVGRKPVAMAAVLLSIASCFVFANVESVPQLMIGRVLQGLSCGLASSALTAYIVDNAPAERAWLGAMLSGSTPLVGLSVGGFAAAFWAQAYPQELAAIYLVFAVLCLISLVALFFSGETIERKAGALRIIRPALAIPTAVKPLMLAAGLAFAGSWLLGGLYQAYSARMVEELFKENNALVAASVLACLFAPNLIGSFLAGKITPNAAHRHGMSLFALAAIGIATSLNLEIASGFFAATIAAGIGSGMAFAGALRCVLQRTQESERGGVLSVAYLLGYVGAVLPNIVVGKAAIYLNLNQIALGYATLAVLIWLIMSWVMKQKTV